MTGFGRTGSLFAFQHFEGAFVAVLEALGVGIFTSHIYVNRYTPEV